MNRQLKKYLKQHGIRHLCVDSVLFTFPEGLIIAFYDENQKLRVYGKGLMKIKRRTFKLWSFTQLLQILSFYKIRGFDNVENLPDSWEVKKETIYNQTVSTNVKITYKYETSKNK